MTAQERRRRRLTAPRVHNVRRLISRTPKAQTASSSLSSEAVAERERETQGCAQTLEDEL